MFLFQFVCFYGMLWGAKASDVELENGKNESSQNRSNKKMEAPGNEESDELRLFHNLMRFYDRDVRPMKNASSPVVVRLGITLTQIFDLDEKNQVLTTNVWLDMEWVDDYLTWKPSEYRDLKSIRIPCERIWLPDMVLYNNADDYTQGFMNSKAMVTHDGNVFWPPPTKLRSKCPVDVTYFPFDHQTCILKFGSWIYDGFQVDVTNRSDEVDMTNYVPNGEWELVKTGIKRNVKYYPCCPEPFPDVTITIVIRRRTLYYISNVVLPCMMMSALTLLVFRLPPDAGEKIALGFTVLLAFSVFMLTVAEKMPETSTSVPLIGMYLTAVMAITTVSIMMTVVVLNFHYRGPSEKPAPKWLKKIILDKIGYWFCADIVRVTDVKDKPQKRLSKTWMNHDPPEASLRVDHVNRSLLLSPKRHLQNAFSEGSEPRLYCDGHHSKLLQVDASTVEIVAHNCVYHQDILRILRCMVIKEEEDIQKVNDSVNYNEEKRLLDRLMFRYDRDVRPIRNASQAIVIKLSITLTQIFDMDEKNQVLTTNVWLDQEWYDELLIWDPAEFSGLDTIRLPCERVWLPDIVLYNNADDYTRGYMQSKAMVRSDGNVFWPPPTKFRSTCPVDVTYFPFDDQTCILKLGSWMYDGFQVDVTNRTSSVDLSNYVPSGEWELLDARIVRNVMYYSCCPEPFPDVTITLVMRRKTLYYMYNVVLPCMMMSVLTLLVFCLPPDSGEKIALGITVLLAFSVFMLAIAEKMPETSESIPLIGIYLTAVMAITSISVIMTVIVLNFHHRGPLKKEVPQWMRRVILKYLAACTCVKTEPLKRCPNEYREFDVSNSFDCPSSCPYTKMETLHLNIDGVGIRDEVKEVADFSSNESLNNINMNDLKHGRHKRASKQNSSATNHSKTTSLTTGNNKVQDEILKSLKYLLSKQEVEEQDMKVINEWRQIATVVDRFLFWVFLVGTVMSSVSFLVIVPMERRGFYG